VLKKENQELLDLNTKEYVEAQQEVDAHQNAHYTCLEHYLDLWHLCCGTLLETLQEPINHTKLLRKCGAINLNTLSKHFPASSACLRTARVVARAGRPRDLRPLGFRPCVS
jgi:hypothetical protein